MVGIGLSGGAESSQANSKTTQDVFGSGHFGNMYGAAGDLYEQQSAMNPQFQQFMMGQVNPFMMGLNPYMMQGFGAQMGGGGLGATGAAVDPALRDSLQQSLSGGPSNTARMYQDIVGGEGNTYVDPLVDDMYNQAWKGLDRGAFKNSAQSAAASGNMGNYSRQMDNSAFAADTMSDVRSKEMQLRAGAYDKDMDWKMQIANQADSNVGAAQDRAIGLLGGGDQNQQFGMGAGLGMQQFGMGMASPWMAMQQFPWANLNNYANALGDKTVLTNQFSSSKAGSWNAGASVGW